MCVNLRGGHYCSLLRALQKKRRDARRVRAAGWTRGRQRDWLTAVAIDRADVCELGPAVHCSQGRYVGEANSSCQAGTSIGCETSSHAFTLFPATLVREV